MNDLEDAIEQLKAATAVAADASDAELASNAARLADMRRLEAANHALQQRVSQLQGQARPSVRLVATRTVRPWRAGRGTFPACSDK